MNKFSLFNLTEAREQEQIIDEEGVEEREARRRSKKYRKTVREGMERKEGRSRNISIIFFHLLCYILNILRIINIDFYLTAKSSVHNML